MTPRPVVYSAVDTERDYQDVRWGNENPHSVLEFLVYMRDYVEEAMHTCSRVADEEANPRALDSIRKVTALGVACMELHGAPRR